MEKKILNGDQAMAFGAWLSGVKMVTAYPGSPSSGSVSTLIELAGENSFHIEWSGNEKVAMEMGIGASMAGRRALVGVKSVGMNAMVDPLMTLNLTRVKGGLVILLGDDPGAYGSQNEQDTRLLAPMVEIPLMEPAGPAEGMAMIQEAFRLSEQFHLPVILRITRSFTQREEKVVLTDQIAQKATPDFVRDPGRFVPTPRNAVEKHRELHQRLAQFSRAGEHLPFNRIAGEGVLGIVGAGFAYQKLLDVAGKDAKAGFRLLKLSNLFPLPEKLIARFLSACEKVLVLEENEPFLEMHLNALANRLNLPTAILGKQSKHLPREGELYRWQIQKALFKFLPGFSPAKSFLKANEQEEIPAKKDNCRGCNYDKVFDALESSAQSLGQQPVIIGDPSCLVTVADRLDGKYAIGSAIGVADGLSKAGIRERAIAVFGDSSFFHSSLPAICNAVHNRSDILMIVLDNKASATTGFQSNPGVAKDALGREAPAVDMENIARACGVPHVSAYRSPDLGEPLRKVFLHALQRHTLELIIVQTV
jgi:indolepyruvate ferredoxin oxidoreductase alpha subunit